MAGIIYQVVLTPAGTVELLQIMEYGELTRFVFNRTETEILRLAGNWNMDEHEDHFGEHRQRVFKYVFEGGRYKEIKLGETKFKYPTESELEDALKEINSKETELLKGVDLGSYSYDGN